MMFSKFKVIIIFKSNIIIRKTINKMFLIYKKRVTKNKMNNYMAPI